MDNPQNFLPHVSSICALVDKLCDRFEDRFEDASVIRTIATHHIYKDIVRPPLERRSRAEKNPTMTCASNHFSSYRAICFEERRHNFV